MIRKTRQAGKAAAGRRTPFTLDGLNCAAPTREVMKAMRKGGIDALNYTIVEPWDDFETSLTKLARILATIRDNDDLVCVATSVREIRKARADGRTAIIMGAQGSTFIEKDPALLGVLARVGFRILQPTYMEQNQLGAGVMVEDDRGLTRLGRDWVAAMNAHRLLIDLSHVGYRTAADCTAASKQPVICSHVNPRSQCESPRNIPDSLIKKVAKTGGVVGATPYPPLVKHATRPTTDDFAGIVAFLIDLVGEDHVGFGSDLSQGVYLNAESWHKSFGPNGKYPRMSGVMGPWYTYECRTTQGFETLAQAQNIRDALRRKGLSARVADKVMGGNFLRVYRDVWGD